PRGVAHAITASGPRRRRTAGAAADRGDTADRRGHADGTGGGLSRVAPPIACGRLAREVRALAARERGADRLRRRIHRQRERGAGVVDETGFSERDASEITEECAVACTELRRVLLGRAELRAHEVTIARARADDRLERPMHRDPLGRAGELRIVRDLRDENRSATWVAAERGELGPGEC